MTEPRRIEVPVLFDLQGTTWVPGLLDTTLRHEGRAVLAESPPPGLSPELQRTIRTMAAGLAGAADTSGGAATVVFAVDYAVPQGEVRYLESLPGLPAAHAVIEATTGLDLLARAVHLGRGGLLKGEPPEARGAALQVDLAARDPEAGFAASPGTVETLRLAAGAGLRADVLTAEGETPGDPFDPRLVRLTAHGQSRHEALERLARGLARTTVTMRGGATDKAFLAELLDRLDLETEPPHPGWLERLVARGEHLPRRGAEAALLAAALTRYDSQLAGQQERFYAAAGRGRLEVPPAVGLDVELAHRGQRYSFHVEQLALDLYRVAIDGCSLEVGAGRPGPAGRAGRSLTFGRRRCQVRVDPHADGVLLVEVDGIPHRVRWQGGPEDRPEPGAAGERVGFDGAPGLAAPTAAAEDGELAEVRRLMLGYDYDRQAVARFLARAPAGPRRPEAEAEAEEILRTFVDLGAIFRQPPADPANDPANGRHSALELLFTYLSAVEGGGDGLPAAFVARLAAALAHYGLASLDPTPALRHSLLRLAISHRRRAEQVPAVLALLERALAVSAPARSLQPAGSGTPAGTAGSSGTAWRELLDRLITESQGREPAIHDLAREVRYRRFDRPLFTAIQERAYAAAEAELAHLAEASGAAERAARIAGLVAHTQPLHRRLSRQFAAASPLQRQALLEIMLRRYYRVHPLTGVGIVSRAGRDFVVGDYDHRGARVRVVATHADFSARADLAMALDALDSLAAWHPAQHPTAAPGDAAPRELALDLYLWRDAPLAGDELATEVAARLAAPGFPAGLRRVVVALASPQGVEHLTFRPQPSRAGDAGGGGDTGYAEERLARGLHPMMAQRLQLWRLAPFQLERLASPEGIYLFHGRAFTNPRDERLFALAEVRDLTPLRDAAGRIVELPQLEHTLMEALAGIRRFQARRGSGERLEWNRVLLSVWPPVDLQPAELQSLLTRLTPLSQGLGLEKVAVRCRLAGSTDRGDLDWPAPPTGSAAGAHTKEASRAKPGHHPATGELQDVVLEISNPGEGDMVMRFRRPATTALKPLRAYAQKVIELRRRGLVHPYEIVKRLAPPRWDTTSSLPHGEFTEYDLDPSEPGDPAGNRLAVVERPPGGNTANLVVGVVRNFTARYPEGMRRVILLADPGRAMGALGEPECRRILAALDLAAAQGVPVEWFAVSAGAAGEAGGTTGSETGDWIARVLRRIVLFTQAGGEINLVVAAVNAGAQAHWNAQATMLQHTRGVLIMTPAGAMVPAGESTGGETEDLQAAGGAERVMGPNGEAQYIARDLGDACRLLLAHYEHTWVAPGERFPRRAATIDRSDREISGLGSPPVEIRQLMAALADQDHPTLERWYGMRDAEIAVVWEAHLGGHPVCLLGFESTPAGTAGTLPPLAAKKVARAIHAASGNRPLVVMANLAGFDGSAEAMRQGELEYAAEIGRAMVDFGGPIVVCGGALAVFSPALHDNLEVVGHPLLPPDGLRPALIAAVERGISREARELESRPTPFA